MFPAQYPKKWWKRSSADVPVHSVYKPILDIRCSLGEGPFWDERTNTLRFVDIEKCKLHFVHIENGALDHKEINLDHSFGITANMAGSDSKIIFGGKEGFGVFDLETNKHEYVRKVWSEDEVKAGMPKRMRANDGAVDSKGRLYVGMMEDAVPEPGPYGVLFRLDSDYSLHRVLENISIPNGISWSTDDKIMYFTDSPSKTIDAYNFDRETGTVSRIGPFFRLDAEDETEAVPDGHVVDEENCLWVAIYGGWQVVRVSPAGQVITVIQLPTRCPTCPVFVGKDLYITSASEKKPEEYPESVRYAGAVFRFHGAAEALTIVIRTAVEFGGHVIPAHHHPTIISRIIKFRELLKKHSLSLNFIVQS